MPFGGAALGEMYNSTECSWNVMVQSLFFSIWPSWMLGGASAAISGVVVLSCLCLFFNWWPERVGRRAGCRRAEPWESLLQRGMGEPWLNRDATGPWWSWVGVLQVQDQTEEIERHFVSFTVSCCARDSPLAPPGATSSHLLLWLG